MTFVPADIQALLAQMGVSVNEHCASRMGTFLDAITEANARFNLTRIPPEDMVPSHVCDALGPLALGLIPQYARVLDVGAGAGIPGIPLKLARPDISLTLVEATLKKVGFMREALELVGADARVLHARAEDLAKDAAHAGMYDVVTARAVAPLERLVGWTLPFVKRGGVALMYKGPQADTEIAALSKPHLQKLSAHIADSLRYHVPGKDWDRRIIVIKKR